MILGLTGGIGSGKSTVARLLEVLGGAVFHSDQVAKEIYFDPAVKAKVTGLLGKESYLSDTVINKAYISSKIFNDTGLLQGLNAILHPAVNEAFKAFAQQYQGRLIVKESALLFEARLQSQVDKILVVAAPDELRIQRVMKRDGLSREDVLKKIKSQLSQEEKIRQADLVIHNDEKELLIPQVLDIYKTLTS
jgi:dephospho-CoA kinase